MYGLKNSEVLAHHILASVGGFFGVYALLNRSLTFGSSETANLIYLFVAGLTTDKTEFIIRLVAFFIYISGIIFATAVSRKCKNGDFRYLSILIDIICCVILAQIPAETHEVLALYPMFFATAVQWLAFSTAAGFSSSSVFSTNNCRQCFAGLTNLIIERDKKYLPRIIVFGGTLVFFHLGVICGWLCMQRWGLRSAYACILLLAAGFIAVTLDRRKKAEPTAAEPHEYETAGR